MATCSPNIANSSFSCFFVFNDLKMFMASCSTGVVDGDSRFLLKDLLEDDVEDAGVGGFSSVGACIEFSSIVSSSC